MPISGGTAIQGLRQGGIEAGQQVLIIGASGGVGTYAVQLAKALGAEVTGVCSTAKLDLLRSIGADHVVDYTREDFADGDRRYDLILDIGGNSRLSRLRRALAPKGTLVIVGGEEGWNLTGGFKKVTEGGIHLNVGQRLTMLASKESHTHIEAVSRFIESGQVTPIIDRTYPLAHVTEAMHHLEAGDVRGKIAITI